MVGTKDDIWYWAIAPHLNHQSFPFICLPKIERITQINAICYMTKEVNEIAREQLVIGLT